MAYREYGLWPLLTASAIFSFNSLIRVESCINEDNEGLGLASADRITSGKEGSNAGGVGGCGVRSIVGTWSITSAGVREGHVPR